jgi:hypothetical protein
MLRPVLVGGAFGLLDFTMLRPVLVWAAVFHHVTARSGLGRVWAAVFHHVTARSGLARFETYEPIIYLIFLIFSGRGKPRITENAGTESADTGVRLY